RAVGHLLLWPRLPRLDVELQRLLQPARPDPLLGPPRHRDGDRDASERQAPGFQRHLPLRAGRVGTVRGMRGAAARGLASGVAVGAIWWAVEAALNWTAGGLVPGAVSLRIAALDLAIAGLAGMGLGVVLGDGAPLALALTAVYGFLRVYQPPGFGAEALFVALAAPAAALGVRLSATDGQRERRGLVLVHLALVATAAVAADALLFTQARSPAAWTLPAHASLFTGMYPSRHGAHLAGGFLPGRSIDGHRRISFPLPEERVTLAEALRDRGYRTAAFAANFSYLYRTFGVAQGFGHYDDAPGLLFHVRPHVVHFAQRFAPGFCLKPFRSAREINAAALAWLDYAPAGRPVFLFVNYMEPHEPWLAPAPYDRWSRGLTGAARLAHANLYTHAVRDFT